MAISVDYLVIGGGGGGGHSGGGGGGAGGYVAGTTSITTANEYAITVGNGGAASTVITSEGSKGENSAYRYGTNIVFNPTTTASGDCLRIPHSTNLNLAGVSWTIECWVNPTGNYVDFNVLWSKRTGNPVAYQGFLNVTNGYIGYSTGVTAYTSTTALVANTWSHCVWQCVGTTIKIYVNGTQVYTTTIAANVDSAQPLVIGAYQNTTGQYQDFTLGAISDFRIVKGALAYADASTLTVPTSPLTAIANTQLLTCQNNRFVDNSANNFTITTVGKPTYSALGPFFLVNVLGGDGGHSRSSTLATSGGSGGGGGEGTAAGAATTAGTAGTTNIPSGAKGFNGGAGTINLGAGGGGGAGGSGNAGSAGTSGAGGVGLSSSITGTAVFRGGGGGGARFPTNGTTGAAGGAGGGGTGGGTALTINGTANTGGGGGGGGGNSGSNIGGAGGSGVGILRYLTSSVANAITTGTPSTDGLYTVLTFNTTGTVTLVENISGMPVNTVAPVISGTVGIGNTFTCTQGTWTGNATITYAYQWYRSGTGIVGATSSTYTMVGADVLTTLTCQVTATNGVGVNFVNSNAISLVYAVPVNTNIDQGFFSTITLNAIKGDAITVVETKEFSLLTPTAIRVDVGDTYSSFSKIAYQVPKGDDITVVEANHFSLFTPTAIRVDVGDTYSSFSKVNYSLLIGDTITVAEAKHFSLSIGTVRQIGDNFTNLTNLFAWPDRTDNITFNTYTGGGSLTSYEAWYLS